jgi:hypothetical protein
MGEPNELPDGDYAIVEMLGHRTLVGRVTEVERFGSKLLQIEVIFNNTLLIPTLHNGSAVYAFTPCSREVAAARQATKTWQLPPSLVAAAPPASLAPPQGDLPFGANEPPDEDSDLDPPAPDSVADYQQADF